MRIIITGTPGTGKSTIAKLLSHKTGLELIDIKKIVKEKLKLSAAHEVDLGKLASALLFLQKKKDFVAEGHLACEIKLPADYIFVLRSDPETLKRRLAGRHYNKKKLDENIMAELLDYCTQRAEKVYNKKPLELDTSGRSAAACVKIMLAAIRQKKKKLESIDYSHELKKYLRLAKR